jgi:hypothetical protein
MNRRIRYALLALVVAVVAVASPAAAGIFSKVTLAAAQPPLPEHVGLLLLGTGLIALGHLSRRRA